MRTGQEGHGTAEVDSEAAFDTAKDRAFDAGVVCVCFFQAVPGFFAAGHLARDDSFATGVFCGAQEHFDLVANSDFRGFTRVCEFFEINAAFHFVAYVDDGLACFNRDDFAFDNRTLVRGVHFEAFVKEGFEFLHRCVSHSALSPF